MLRRESWIGFLTLCNHEIVRILRIWPQTLVPPIVTTALYYVIFGSVMGNKIGTMGGVPYIQYMMPGLVMMTIIDNSYVNTLSSFFTSKFFRSIEELLITPMPSSAILCGFLFGGIVRGLAIGTMVACMSLFFSKITVYSWSLTLLIAILTSTFLALVGFVNGVFAKKFDDLSIVPTFILMPLSFFGGLFYSVDLLPPFWRAATHANPLFYMIGGFRYAVLGQSDVHIGYTILLLTVGIFILYYLCIWLLRRGIGVRF